MSKNQDIQRRETTSKYSLVSTASKARTDHKRQSIIATTADVNAVAKQKVKMPDCSGPSAT